MKSGKAGESTSQAEVTNISSHGVWIDVKDREYFMSYEDYPWFKEARVGEILNVQLHHASAQLVGGFGAVHRAGERPRPAQVRRGA